MLMQMNDLESLHDTLQYFAVIVMIFYERVCHSMAFITFRNNHPSQIACVCCACIVIYWSTQRGVLLIKFRSRSLRSSHERWRTLTSLLYSRECIIISGRKMRRLAVRQLKQAEFPPTLSFSIDSKRRSVYNDITRFIFWRDTYVVSFFN